VLCREMPFEETGLDGMKIAMAVPKGRRPSLDFVANSCPIELVSLMHSCWYQNPEKRPSMDFVIDKLKSIRVTKPRNHSPELVPGMTSM
jgi:hypothetical protein